MREHLTEKNEYSTDAERKFTQERKIGQRGCAGLGNVVTLRRKLQEALQMIQSSECTWPGVRGRQRGVRGIRVPDADEVWRGVHGMHQGAEKHKGEKMPPASKDADSQSPWADDSGP